MYVLYQFSVLRICGCQYVCMSCQCACQAHRAIRNRMPGRVANQVRNNPCPWPSCNPTSVRHLLLWQLHRSAPPHSSTVVLICPRTHFAFVPRGSKYSDPLRNNPWPSCNPPASGTCFLRQPHSSAPSHPSTLPPPWFQIARGVSMPICHRCSPHGAG